MVSYVLLNIYYILWKKAKRGVSLFLNDPNCIVCLLYIEFNLLSATVGKNPSIRDGVLLFVITLEVIH